MCSSDLRKHVGEIQTFTPAAIVDYIKGASDVFERMQKERDAMKQIEMTKRTKAELIGRMMIEEQFITSTQLNIISRELQAPTHDYNAKDSLWELYNYTTFAMKETHPAQWMDRHIKAHKFFNDYVYDQTAPWEAETWNLPGEEEAAGNALNQLTIF